MSKKITIWKDPYDCGFDISSRRNVEINECSTIIIGCNGLGKTTFLSNIKSELKDKNIPCLSYDNLTDGGKKQSGYLLNSGNTDDLARLLTSSEGENISNNLAIRIIPGAKEFIKTGKLPKKKNNIRGIFDNDKDTNKDEKPISDERWILLDAVDSGYSIDNIIQLKLLFKLMINDAMTHNVKLYIVASANEYELASGMPCFDLAKGEYVEVNSYDEYKNIILQSRDYKDNKRYNKYKK